MEDSSFIFSSSMIINSTLLKIFLFILIVIFFDRIIGITCEKLYNRSNDNTIYRLCYTLDSAKEDILIFGSSRAQHHFVSRVINKNTGLSCYNCGFGGEGLVFSLIQLNECLKRTIPKLIVLEVSPNILIDPETQQKLKILMPFHKRDPLIFNALTNDEMLEKVKLLSSIYPYNSTIASLITGQYKKNLDTLKGFNPLIGIIDTIGLIKEINASFPTSSIPYKNLQVLKQFIALCNNHNIKIAIVVSPLYQTNTNLDEMIKEIELTCLEFKNIYFLDYSKFDSIYLHISYFKDNLHLNYEGAQIFSEVISKRFKEIIVH